MRKVKVMLCACVVSSAFVLIILFATHNDDDDESSKSGTDDSHDTGNGGIATGNGGIAGLDTDDNAVDSLDADDSGRPDATFWIFDVVYPFLVSAIATRFSWMAGRLVYKIIKHDYPGYHLWSCCVAAFEFWFLTFVTPSWMIAELSIIMGFMFLVSSYLFLQQISHRIMTGLDVEEYIAKHCSKEPRLWLMNELKQVVGPYSW